MREANEKSPAEQAAQSAKPEQENAGAAWTPPSMLAGAASVLGTGVLQRKLARRALQRRARGEGANPADVTRTAESGLSGAPGKLPHLDTIQRSFGRHDVSGVAAHVGGPAAEAAQALGAEAYAVGSSTAFAGAPSLHTAAHEAAHVVQQRGGVQLAGGVGQAGDVYEQHADAVADKVVAGESAEGLLNSMAGPASAGGGGGGVQRQAVQFWSGHEHRAMGNMGAILATGSANFSVEEFRRQHGRTNFRDGQGVTMGGGLHQSPDPTLQDLDRRGRNAVRIPNGVSFGSASEFAGDFDLTPGDLRREDNDHDPNGADFLEMASNAQSNINHFYPLAGEEYRAHHAAALRAAAAGNRRQALVEEGFASHFLEDSFAAGHLAPRALDRTTVTGRGQDELGLNRTKTWHDALNAVDDPGGLPTTRGGFHGDDTMTGDDLATIAQDVGKSLREVLTTLAGAPEPANIVLPTPDYSAIMASPKYGPLWRRMMSDYEEDLRQAEGADSNGAPDNLTTDGGTTVGTTATAAAIRNNVFGGQGPRLTRLASSEWNGDILVFNLTAEGRPAPAGTRVWIKWFDKDLGYDRDGTGREQGTLANDRGAGLNDTDEQIGGPVAVSLADDGIGSARAAADDTNDTYAVLYADAECQVPIGRSNTQGNARGRVQKPYQVAGMSWSGKTLSFSVQRDGRAVDGRTLFLRWYNEDSSNDRDSSGNLGQTIVDADSPVGGVHEVRIRGGQGSISVEGDANNSGDTYGVLYLDRACTIPLRRSPVQP